MEEGVCRIKWLEAVGELRHVCGILYVWSVGTVWRVQGAGWGARERMGVGGTIESELLGVVCQTGSALGVWVLCV